MNTNPNEPIEVSPSVLFPSAIRQSVNTMVNESFLLGNNAAQLTAKTLRTEVDSYNWNAFPTVWKGMYESLTDVYVVEQLSIEAENQLMEGAAVTLRCWIYSVLTNAYGDIPYSEAISGGKGNLTPAYDLQQNIYANLLSELQRANTLLASGEGSIDGDILLGGNAGKWQKFANSLRLRLLMQASNQISDAPSQIAQIVSSGNILSSNDDNIALTYLNIFPNQFPLIPLKIGDFDAVALSKSALDVLSAHNDPRLARYARPDNDDYDNPVFSGAVNGSNSANCSKTGSRLGPQYFNDPQQTLASGLGLNMAEGIILSYAEVEFLIAKAAYYGWVSEDIESHYKAGIQASMEYHQVEVAPFGWSSFDDFYENSGAAYSNQKTDIWQQKWLALYFHGLEPYFEVRRWYIESNRNFDDIPFLSPSCENLNNDQLPLRFLYPGEEQSLNAENYQEAVQRIGGSNSFNAGMWITQ